jgi:hypothetical protein
MNSDLSWNWSEEISLIKKKKKLSIPFNIFLKEAAELSGFAEKYWQKTAEQPGLSSAAPVLSEDIGAELAALIQEISNLHTSVTKMAESEPKETGLSLKARKWISEMHHMFRWKERFPSDTPISINVPKLLREYRKKTKAAPMLREWIDTYLQIVRTNRNELSTVPGLTDAFLAEGARLAEALGNVRRGRSRGSDEYRNLLARKQALLHILLERVARVRTAVRFVFRNYRSLQKLASSDFERKRRHKNRKKKEKQ